MSSTPYHILRRQSNWVNIGETVGFIHDIKYPTEETGFSFNIRHTANEDHNLKVILPRKFNLPIRFRKEPALPKVVARLIQDPSITDYPSIVISAIKSPDDPMTIEIPSLESFRRKDDHLKGLKFYQIEESMLSEMTSSTQKSIADEFRNEFEISGIVVTCHIKRDENKVEFTILNGRGDILPCVCFGKAAHNLYSTLSPKTVLLCRGRVINQKLKINAEESVIQTVLQVSKAMPPKFGFDTPTIEKVPAWMIDYFKDQENSSIPQVSVKNKQQLEAEADSDIDLSGVVAEE